MEEASKDFALTWSKAGLRRHQILRNCCLACLEGGISEPCSTIGGGFGSISTRLNFCRNMTPKPDFFFFFLFLFPSLYTTINYGFMEEFGGSLRWKMEDQRVEGKPPFSARVGIPWHPAYGIPVAAETKFVRIFV